MKSIKKYFKSPITSFMLHSPFKLKSGKKKGFSLIELLVVVAIIGVLAAVAIPAYNGYRRNAAQSAIISSLNNVAKAFSACLTLNQWGDCDTPAEMKVSCPGCDNESSNAMNDSFCINVSNEVSGMVYTGCLETGGGVPSVVGNWPILCNRISTNYTCLSMTSIRPPTNTCADYGCMATAPVPNAAADCPLGTETPSHACAAGAGDRTNGTQPVGCMTGMCG